MDEFGYPGGRTPEEKAAAILAPPKGPEETFVLFDQDTPVGTASLVHDDLAARRDLTPSPARRDPDPCPARRALARPRAVMGAKAREGDAAHAVPYSGHGRMLDDLARHGALPAA